MKVTTIGAGYVGLVTGACLAEMGNHVVSFDVNEDKIRILREGGIPIHEPGLHELIQRNAQAGRLEFTTDPGHAVAHGTMLFIAVGTPPDEDGSAICARRGAHDRPAHDRLQGGGGQEHGAGGHGRLGARCHRRRTGRAWPGSGVRRRLESRVSEGRRGGPGLHAPGSGRRGYGR